MPSVYQTLQSQNKLKTSYVLFFSYYGPGHLDQNRTIMGTSSGRCVPAGIVLKNHKQFIRNNKPILKTQQRFKSEGNNVFTEEINKIALSSNDDKRTKSIDSIETYAHGTSKHVVSEKEKVKCKKLIKRYKT